MPPSEHELALANLQQYKDDTHGRGVPTEQLLAVAQVQATLAVADAISDQTEKMQTVWAAIDALVDDMRGRYNRDDDLVTSSAEIGRALTECVDMLTRIERKMPTP